jgi:hypothetical protein
VQVALLDGADLLEKNRIQKNFIYFFSFFTSLSTSMKFLGFNSEMGTDMDELAGVDDEVDKAGEQDE